MLEGLEENCRSFGVDWPTNRYLLITLSADADVKGRKPMQTSVVHGWRCRYDLQIGKFDVPAFFSDHNAKAVVPSRRGLLITANIWFGADTRSPSNNTDCRPVEHVASDYALRTRPGYR
jgi:hypothetical protein